MRGLLVFEERLGGYLRKRESARSFYQDIFAQNYQFIMEIVINSMVVKNGAVFCFKTEEKRAKATVRCKVSNYYNDNINLSKVYIIR